VGLLSDRLGRNARHQVDHEIKTRAVPQARQPLHTALATRQFGKFGAQMAAGIAQVKTLELAEAQLMEQEGERHQLRKSRQAGSLAPFRPHRQQMPFPYRLKHTTKVFDQSIKFG